MARKLAWLKAAIIVAVVFAVFFLLGTGIPLVMAEVYSLNLTDWYYHAPAQTTIYTSDGKVLTEFGYKRVHKDAFPDLLRQAVVAVEDRRFYQHSGIDPRGMLRALWVDLKLGEKAQGGSTITQQTARTLFLTNKKSMLRKTKEIIIATALERKYAKDDILNMYLNEIYMGRGVCGMGAAAQEYFGKDVFQLSLGEISCLVAMISAPEYYSPDHDAEALKMRQAVVLNVMVREGLISQEEATDALSENLHVLPQDRKRLQHPYFTLYILEKLKEEYGDDAVYRGGLKVYTTVDSRMQDTAERILESHVRRLGPLGITARDGALVSVEPGTGAIKAMVGGADFQRNQINMAVKPRQPGSAIKPLIYAAAMDKGLVNDSTMLNNRPRDFNGYRPRNAKSGPAEASVRNALAFSYNVPAVEVLNDLGVKEAIRYLKQFGVSTVKPGDVHLALALGGMEKGISPLEMAAAYAVFANEGTWAEPYAIEKVEDSDGTVLYEHTVTTRQVISRSVAREMTLILRDVVRYGTGTAARIWVPAAGKTGTTSQSRDLWFVGYTGELSTAVWLGNSNNDVIRGVATYGGTRCAPIWRDYMNALLDKGLLRGGADAITAGGQPDAEEVPGETESLETPATPTTPGQHPQPAPGETLPGEPGMTPGTPPEGPAEQSPGPGAGQSPAGTGSPANPLPVEVPTGQPVAPSPLRPDGWQALPN